MLQKTAASFLALCLSALAFAQASAQPPMKMTHNIRLSDAAKDSASFTEMVHVLQYVAGVIPGGEDEKIGNLAITGSADQLAAADWLQKELDQAPAGGKPQATIHHQFTGADGKKTDVFYLANMKAPVDTQELITVLRQVVQTNSLFWYSRRHAIALRDTPERIATAEWLVPRLDRSLMGLSAGEPVPNAKSERRQSAERNEITEILSFEKVPDPLDLQALNKEIRKQAHVVRVFSPYSLGAVVVNATPEQIAEIDQLVAGQSAIKFARLTE